jgi:hypothetical protein
MLNSVIKRAVIDGKNSVNSMLFTYRNRNFLRNVWKLINESLGEEYQPISNIRITSTNVLFIKGRHSLKNTQIICKIPLDEEAVERARMSFCNIQSLATGVEIGSNLIPFPLKVINSQYGNIYIETMFVGKDGYEAVRSSQISENHAINQGINVIKDIQDRFPCYSVVFCEEIIDEFIEEVKQNFSRNGIKDFQHEKVRKLLEKGRNKEITFGFSHGDYWLGNIIFNQNKLIGIIDWDRFRLDRPIVYDRMHLEIYYHAMKKGWSLGDEIITRYTQNPSDDLIIYWCYFLKNSMNSNPLITKNKRWLEKNYFKVIQKLA